MREKGYKCRGGISQPSICDPIPAECGNSIREIGEDCDNGNVTGCIDCTVDPGYRCTGDFEEKSECEKICGNGMLDTD